MNSLPCWFICLFRFAVLIALAWTLVCAVKADESQGSPLTVRPVASELHEIGHDTSLVAVPTPSPKAIEHYRTGMVLFGVSTLWSLFIPVLFLFTGFSAHIRSWAERIGHKWYFAFALYCVVFFGLNYLINLPLSYYAGFVRPHSYDLSNQTLGKWFGDSLTSRAVSIAVVLTVGWLPFVLMKRSPRRWWLYMGLLALPLLCLLLIIQPVLIDPLFNKFEPMTDKRLEAKILALAARAGIEHSRVYQVNKSVDTKTVNAYVTGLLGTKRIVLWDTTVRTLDEDELLSVMGHEMGHYVLGHIIKQIAINFVLIFVSLYLAHRLSGPIIGRFKKQFGFNALSDIAAMPLAFLLINIFSMVGTPVPLALYRHHEHEADRYGLELTHNNHAAATAFVKLQQNNLSIPRPGAWHTFWLASHPSLGDRIDFCNSYRPWETGQPSKYGDHMKQ